jgi:hypothetical protein
MRGRRRASNNKELCDAPRSFLVTPRSFVPFAIRGRGKGPVATAKHAYLEVMGLRPCVSQFLHEIKAAALNSEWLDATVPCLFTLKIV